MRQNDTYKCPYARCPFEFQDVFLGDGLRIKFQMGEPVEWSVPVILVRRKNDG